MGQASIPTSVEYGFVDCKLDPENWERGGGGVWAKGSIKRPIDRSL